LLIWSQVDVVGVDEGVKLDDGVGVVEGVDGADGLDEIEGVDRADGVEDSKGVEGVELLKPVDDVGVDNSLDHDELKLPLG
jgi:hypothetical protein